MTLLQSKNHKKNLDSYKVQKSSIRLPWCLNLFNNPSLGQFLTLPGCLEALLVYDTVHVFKDRGACATLLHPKRLAPVLQNDGFDTSCWVSPGRKHIIVNGLYGSIHNRSPEAKITKAYTTEQPRIAAPPGLETPEIPFKTNYLGALAAC